MNRRAELVVLCEDRQQAVFIKRFFKRHGYTERQLISRYNPSGQGSGEQWVRQNFPKELQLVRKRTIHSCLIVMIDADTSAVEKIQRSLEATCIDLQIPKCTANDPVLFLIPNRNIETWIQFLNNPTLAVDETIPYPKLKKEGDCALAVKTLDEMCRAATPIPNMPPSLVEACTKYRQRFP